MNKILWSKNYFIYSSLAKCRRVVECAFGVLKQRFTCVGKALRVKSPEYAAHIINACIALHNFILMTNYDNDDEFIIEGLENFDQILNNEESDEEIDVDDFDIDF